MTAPSHRELNDTYVKGKILAWVSSLDVYDLQHVVPAQMEERIAQADKEFAEHIDAAYQRGFDRANATWKRQM